MPALCDSDDSARVTTFNALHSAPTAIVARSWTGGPLTLGLDRPMAILGGDALPAHQLPQDLDLDWVQEIQNAVVEACRKQSKKEYAGFSMAPLVISGQLGLGRTLIARSIARHAGVPFLKLDVSANIGMPNGCTTGQSPDIAFPNPIILAIAAAKCANPVVLLDGIDDATSETISLVRALTDSITNCRWNEPSIAAIVDLSRVTWILQSSSPLGVPHPLAHLRQFEIYLDHDARQLRNYSIIAEVFHDLSIDPRLYRHRGGTLMEPLFHDPHTGAAELRVRIIKLISMMAAAA